MQATERMVSHARSLVRAANTAHHAATVIGDPGLAIRHAKSAEDQARWLREAAERLRCVQVEAGQ